MAARSHRHEERRSANPEDVESNPILPNGAGAVLAANAGAAREMMSFVAMRLEKDGEAIREISHCQSWAEAMKLQSHWVQQTIRDYQSEMTKLASMYVPNRSD